MRYEDWRRLSSPADVDKLRRTIKRLRAKLEAKKKRRKLKSRTR